MRKWFDIAGAIFCVLFIGYGALAHFWFLVLFVGLMIVSSILAFIVLYIESVLRLRWIHKKSWKDAFKLNAPYDIY